MAPTSTNAPTAAPTATQTPSASVSFEVRLIKGSGYEIVSKNKVVKNIEYLYDNTKNVNSTCSEIVPEPIVSVDKSKVYFIEKANWNQVKVIDSTSKISVAYTLPSGYNFATSLNVNESTIAVTGMSALPNNIAGETVNDSIKTAYFVGGQKYDAVQGNQTFIMNSFSDQFLATSYYTRCSASDASDHVYIQGRSEFGGFRNMNETGLAFANSTKAITYDVDGTFYVWSSDNVPVVTIRQVSMNDLEETVLKSATGLKFLGIKDGKASFTLYHYVSGTHGEAKFNEELFEISTN